MPFHWKVLFGTQFMITVGIIRSRVKLIEAKKKDEDVSQNSVNHEAYKQERTH